MLKNPHIRLTHTARNKIAIKLIGDRFSKQKEEIAKKQTEFADWLYERWYAPSMEKIFKLGIPRSWFYEHSTLYFTLAQGPRLSGMMSQTRFLPACNTWGGSNRLSLVEQDRYNEIPETHKINVAENNLKQELMSALNKFSTYNQLVSAWPQIKPEVDAVICPEKYQTESSNLPALDYASLTNKIRSA